MGAAVGLRGDYAAGQLRGLAKRSVDAAQTRRLLALAAIYEGGSRTEAAKIGGVGLQTVRDWVLAFNAEGPGGLINGKAPGNASLLNDEQRQALARIVEDGPNPAAHAVVRWRLSDLAQWVFDAFAIAISKQTLSRELCARCAFANCRLDRVTMPRTTTGSCESAVSRSFSTARSWVSIRARRAYSRSSSRHSRPGSG